MKYLWATLMVTGIIIAPSAQNMGIELCVEVAVFGVALTIYSGSKFIKEMEK